MRHQDYKIDKSEMTLDEIGLQYSTDAIPLSGVKYSGGDKLSHDKKFTLIYDNLFKQHFSSSIRTKSTFNLLEIGVSYGRSLAMWSDYFPNGNIYGIDKSLKEFASFRPKLESAGAFKNTKIYTRELDLKDLKLAEKIKDYPKFNIIVDDALHTAEQQYKNFIIFWQKLSSGGIYIIEDITEPDTFIELFSTIYVSFLNPIKCKKKNAISATIANIQSFENLFIITKKY